MKRRTYTPEQLANDPSLKYNDYRWGEALWSDKHKDVVRFIEYVGVRQSDIDYILDIDTVKIRVATVLGISPLPELVEQLSLRRVSSHGHEPGEALRG